LGDQHTNQQQQILKYYCSKCDILLRITRDDLDIDSRFSNSREECPYCGSLISKTLKKVKEHGITTTKTGLSPSPSSSLCLLPAAKIQTAYEVFSNRLTFGIEKIDSVLELTNGETVCIVAADEDDDNNNKKYFSMLLSRLCVRALMPNRQGGFNSSKVIVVDAGNTSDLYQYINFARQYGLNIKTVLQSIIVSRSFTIYQLANTIINELPKVIDQMSGVKITIIICELLSMFVNDPQVQIKEAESLIRQIINAVIKICTYNNILCIMSFCSNNNTKKTYARIILQRLDKSIQITSRGVGGNDKMRKKNKNDDDMSINIKIKDNKNHSHHDQQHSIILQEKALHLVSNG
jgi:Rad51